MTRGGSRTPAHESGQDERTARSWRSSTPRRRVATSSCTSTSTLMAMERRSRSRSPVGARALTRARHAPPQRAHPAALTLVQATRAKATARSTTRTDRLAGLLRSSGLNIFHDRDDPEQRRPSPQFRQLPQQARMGVVAPRTGRRYLGVRNGPNDLAPPKRIRQRGLAARPPRRTSITSVTAGDPRPGPRGRTLANLQQAAAGRSGGGTVGHPRPGACRYIGPYNVNSIMNPILVHCRSGSAIFFNMHRNKPIVRPGGVAIYYHPVPRRVQPDPPPQLHRLLRGGPRRRPPGPVDDRDQVRGAVTPPTPVTSTFTTGRATPTTACTLSTCGTGARMRRGLPRRRHLRRRRPQKRPRAWAATGRHRASATPSKMATDTVERSA